MLDSGLNKKLLLAITIAALSGCSGGGSNNGGNDGDELPQQAPAGISLSGEAVKGVLASAIVTAKSLDGATTYGTTQTASDGTYSLAGLTLGAGPVLVELTTDSDTEMTCDSATGCTRNGTKTAFGGKFVFDDPSFMLTAILPGIGDTDTSARLMVTPVTHMAAQRAITLGASTAEEVEGINRATAKLLGLDDVDITSIAPSDITSKDSSTDDSTVRKYGALVAAFSTLAEASGGDVAAIIDSIADDFAIDGSMKANTTTEGELALANIFSAAQESAQAAEDAGIDLGETGADLALESIQAKNAESDSEVTPDTEETTPTSQLTEAEATEQGIALLEDMNNWYQALTSVDVETKGDMYQEHLQAASELLPAFDETSDALQTWNRLIIKSETVCIYEWEGTCWDYDTRNSGGPLFDSVSLMSALISYASYLETNHGSNLATENDDGTFTISTNDLGDDLYDLYIFEALETEEGNLAEGTEIIATYTWGSDEEITNIDFYGTGSDMIIASEANPATLTYTHNDAAIKYLLSDLSASKRNGSDVEIDTLAGDLSVTLTFNSIVESENYLTALESGDVVDPGSIAAIDIALNGNVSAGEETADINLSAKLTSGTDSTRNLDVSFKISSDSDGDGNAEIDGTLTLTGSADYAQSGNSTEGFDVKLTNVNGTLNFDGNVSAALDDGSTLDFTGSVSMSADGGFTAEGESGIESQIIEFDGTATLVDATGPQAVTTAFDGDASVAYRAIKTPEGERLIIDDSAIMHLEEVTLNGDLSTGTVSNGTASLSVTGVLSIDNLNTFTVAEPSLPEEGLEFNISGTITKTSDDVAVINFDAPIIEQFTDAVGFDGDDSYSYTSIPLSITRVFYEGNPDTFESAYYEIEVTYENYVTQYYLDGYDLYDTEGPISTADIRDIAADIINNDCWTNISVYADTFDVRARSIWGACNWDSGTSIVTSNFEFSVPMVIDDVWLDVDEIIDSTETEDNYRNVSVALTIDATATGLDEAEIRVVATRTSQEDFIGSVQLSYNSLDKSAVRSLNIKLDSSAAASNTDKNYLTVKNADTEMVITATCIDAQDDPDACVDSELEFAGQMFVGDLQVGTLESRNGVPVFMFGNEDKYRILTPNFLVEKVVE